MKEQEYNFNDIAPYSDSEFHSRMENLVKEPGFLHVINYTMPPQDVPALIEELLKIDNTYDFQHQVMFPFLEMLAKTTTSGISLGGVKYLNPSSNYTFITNHRDIVLDASFLNLAFLRRGLPTSEVAIGNNLLIFDWITELVRLNKSFIVKRNTGLREGLLAAKKLSAYIHHCLLDKRESVWIAQRNGRAKDGRDATDQGIVKMFAMSGSNDKAAALAELNIVPVAVSYEWESCDMLKAVELCKSRNAKYVKKAGEDLNSILTGLLQPKGRVHIEICEPLREEELRQFGNCVGNELNKKVAALMDCRIYEAYRLTPNNFIASDMRSGSNRFADRYTDEQRAAFAGHMSRLDECEGCDKELLREIFLGIYANPVEYKNFD